MTAAQHFLDGRVRLHAGDCREVLATLPESSVDGVATDPPYHLASIVKRFGRDDSAPAKAGAAAHHTGAFARSSRGFMGQRWDGGQIAHEPETWKAVLRVLKPGGYLVAFHASRNWHHQAMAIELAGFEIRDCLTELFSPGALAGAFLDSLNAEQALALARIIEAGDPLADLFWIYGTGFPKSHDLAKAIDKRGGALARQTRQCGPFR